MQQQSEIKLQAFSFQTEINAPTCFGGSKGKDVNVPIADRLYDQHLVKLRQEGLFDG